MVASPKPVAVGADQHLPEKPKPGCACKGTEVTEIVGVATIGSFAGAIPSPLKLLWYVPGQGDGFKMTISDTELRKWVREAAAYQGIPHLLLAVILQQENGPNATTFQKIGQFGERSITTFAAIMDNVLWDAIPDKIAGGSTGLANMSRNALKGAATYSETTYCRPPLPDSVKYRILGWNQDTRISGDDCKADLYYCAAHLRELIDRVTKIRCHSGALNSIELENVIKAYNGSGPLAEKYAKDAMNLIKNAAEGKAVLYFYEK